MNSSLLQKHTSQQGLSLIELMIALAVSSFLVLGVFQIFIGSSNTDRVAESYSRIQENGRLAMDILTRNLRMAGYQGCIDPEQIDLHILADDPPTTDLGADGVRGYETDDSAWTTTANRQSPLGNITGERTGSDLIYVQYINPTGVSVVCTGSGSNSCEAVNANIKVDSNRIGLKKYDIAVVSDCESADMFRIVNTVKESGGDIYSHAHSNSNNSSNNLSKTYDEDSQLFTFRAIAYYVKDTGRDNSRGNDIYALYQFDGVHHADSSATPIGKEDELVEGIEQLQILYGQRLSDGKLRFVPADDASLNFDDVEAVRVSILVSDSAPVRQDNDSRTYSLAGVDVGTAGTPAHDGDQRLRQVFTSTIFMRNLSR